MRRQQSCGPSPDSAVASAGGRGNEAGSVFRAGVAAYLAAHGLAGRGVEAAGYAESGPPPVRLSFETGEAVDDIRCELADGTVLRFQAKRACGDDRHLTATVAQWAGQVHDLRAGDMVGLATAEPRGYVKDLGRALERLRRSVPGPHTAREEKALALVRGRLPAETFDEVADRVLQAALVMTVSVSSPREEGFRSVANLLDGTIVAPGSGSTAISSLQAAFWKQAKDGTGSNLNDWLQVLAEAKLQVFADTQGPAGARRRAELDAVAAYRARLASRDGVVEFSLLADALLPMTYEPLAASLRASVPVGNASDAEFLFLARRWPRMLLTGLPGMGKSTALVQAAARWAAAPGAPVPVVVPLRKIAPRYPRSGADITLAVLIEAATAGMPERDRAPLRRALQRAVTTGDAVLLLDGLDECWDRQAAVADGLATVIRDLPLDTGVVLATRDSALPAAGKLNMPEARLTEPSDLDSVLAALLRHAAQRLPAADRDQWISQREQQLDEMRSGHRDLFEIPLFAVLLTLLLAQPGSRTMPRGRAQLLAAAVRDTVQQWEVKRLSEDPVPLQASTDQILDGFASISHAYISRPGECDTRLAARQVETALRERWDLSAGQARERAREIMRFWNEHVGVFTASSGSGQIEARSRVFAEVGEAMWAESCDPADLQAWITGALDDDGCREQVTLACGLSGDISDEVIAAARRAASPAAGMRSLLWAADAAAEGAQPSTQALTFLTEELANAAGQPGAEERTPAGSGIRRRWEPRPAWQYLRRLAMLPLPDDLRSKRDRLISELADGEYEQTLVSALAALADAKADSSQVLQPAQATSVKALLARTLPDRVSSSPATPARSGGFHPPKRKDVLPGHQGAALEAARYVAQLGKEAADDIYRIAYQGSFRDYERVSRQLSSLGFESPKETRPGLSIPEMFPRLARIGGIREIWPKFFEIASSLAPPRSLSDGERWRFPGIAALASALLAMKGTVVGLVHAFESEQPTLRGCMVAAAHAGGLDMPGISAESALVLEAWPSGNRDVVDVIFAPPYTRCAIDATHLDSRDKDALLGALGAGSDWLANTARTYLLNAHDPQVGRRAAARIREVAPNRRASAVMVAIANDPNPADAASRFLDDSDPTVRAGAASGTRMLARPGANGPWDVLLSRALADDDQAVRRAAGATPESYWSCDECGQSNKIGVSRCSNCGDDEQLRIVTHLGDPD
jgi:hypothetical protein